MNVDVPMGGYDSSQIADLVGLYILHILNRIISSEQIGLYRDDGLIYILNSNCPNSSSIQKKIIRAFKLLGFKIEISSNNKIVNFQDVTLDLSINTYKTFKSDQSPSYTNINLNHSHVVYYWEKRNKELLLPSMFELAGCWKRNKECRSTSADRWRKGKYGSCYLYSVTSLGWKR